MDDSSDAQHNSSSASWLTSETESFPCFDPGRPHDPASPSLPPTPAGSWFTRSPPASDSANPHDPPASPSLPHTPGRSWFSYETGPPPGFDHTRHHDPGPSSRPGTEPGSTPDSDPPVDTPPHDGGGNASRKRKPPSNTRKDTDSWDYYSMPRRKRHAAETSRKRRDYINNMMKTATPGRTHEINLLNDMILFRNKHGRWPYNSRHDMRQFYRHWTEWREMFADRDILSNKMVDLHERFVKNYQRRLSGDDIEHSMDPTEVRVYRLSYRIWGHKTGDPDYSSEQTISDDQSDPERVRSSSTDYRFTNE